MEIKEYGARGEWNGVGHEDLKTQDTVLNGLLRHILTAAGGALVARGSLAESELDLAVGAIITLAGVIWSAIAKRKK